MISVRGLIKSFGDQILYDGAELQLNAGDRYALVGVPADRADEIIEALKATKIRGRKPHVRREHGA